MLKAETTEDEGVDVEVQAKGEEHISSDTLLGLYESMIQEGYDIEGLTAIMKYLFNEETKESKDDAE